MHRICDITPIHAYSESGFALWGGEVRHDGPVLLLPEGVFSWPVSHGPDALTADDLAPAMAAAPGIDFIILGTGAHQIFPPADLHAACASAQLGLEVMATGPACRTLSLLFSEDRQFAAALMPAGRGAQTASLTPE